MIKRSISSCGHVVVSFILIKTVFLGASSGQSTELGPRGQLTPAKITRISGGIVKPSGVAILRLRDCDEHADAIFDKAATMPIP